MNNIETMKLALEALETLNSGDTYKTHNAATALRQVIEQAQQAEPVAWMHPDGRLWTFGRGFNKSTFTIPLYTSTPPRQPLTDEMTKQMKNRCDSYEMRGAFVDGWISAEQAHGIKGEA